MPAEEGRGTGDGPKTIHVVYAAAAQHSTGAQMPQQVVAVQEDRKAAEDLEAAYNSRPDSEDHLSERAFIRRYTLPYVAPAVRDLGVRG